MKQTNQYVSLKLIIFFIGLITTSISLGAGKIKHLQPAFWWTGMVSDELQILVHGDQMGSTVPTLDYPGVTIKSIETVENANYLFINLSLDNNTQPGTFNITFKQDGKSVATYLYELKSRRKGSAQRPGFSPADVIYLITPDRFANGDISNDSTPDLKEGLDMSYRFGRHGGDLQGIIDHLDYLQKMGFTQIWMMPVLQNDVETQSYHGYSTTDYYTIDSRFGDNNLYRQLSRSAREKGIGLIMDMIPNHIGSEHWWMKDMPSKDWINHQGKFVATTHIRETLHDPHRVKSEAEAFNDGWFVPSMPDLNQRNPLLAKYLIQNAIWWVEFAELSGIRVDTWSYSDMDFLSKWTKRLTDEYPNLNIVGEEWTTNAAITAFWQRGSKRHNDYQSYLPSVMDFPLQAKVISGLKNKESWGTGLKEIYYSIANDFLYGDPYNLVVFPDNHDMSRIASQLDDDIALIKMALSYFLTTRGIPQIFYGTEILMNNPGTEDHGIIRSDFPGGWAGDKVNAFTGKGLRENQKAMQVFITKLLNWRKSNQAITKGKLTHYVPRDGVYVFFRHHQDKLVMVVLNKNETAVKLETVRFNKMLQDRETGTDILTGKKHKISEHLTIAEKSALILEIR
ncbi:MAG: glycoside hydrolase family 13 protein [Gammaproteobacteria bacterium]|nr:glycoside hydrolase family 13 protein [Gammaproteobacteria bacterium]